MRCFFIYNPNSGRGKILKHVPYIEKKLGEFYEQVDIRSSTSAEDVTERVKEAAGRYDAIIVGGGDGTFNNAVCGIAGCPVRPALGFIPCGTGNDNAGNLRISRFPRKAVKTILAQHTAYHDVGKINDTYFLYVTALGSGSSSSFTTDQEAKKKLGRLAYAKNGIAEFFSRKTIKSKLITEDGVWETEGPLIMILNTKSVGGIRFNRYGHLNDGYFDILLVRTASDLGRWNVIRLFIRGLLGFRKRPVVSVRSRKFTIEVDDDFIWTCDGDRGPKGTINVENLHNHLRIFVPKRKKRNGGYGKKRST